jgi:acyl-coenzyme A thioesterase PaaI-like protein
MNAEEQIRAFIRRSWDIIEAVDDPTWAAKRVAAAALRRLNSLLICSDAPEPALLEAAQRIEAALAALTPHAAPTFKEGFDSGDYIRHPERYADRAWITGQCNPISPLLELSHDGGAVAGKVVFDNSYVGAPGWVHGGAVAAVFDQALGYCLILAGEPCVTAELAVRFHSPTPAHQPLQFSAEIAEDRGREVLIKGECHHDDRLTASATATFVRLQPRHFAAVLKR